MIFRGDGVRAEKVLVLGVDGASPLLVERWLDHLPIFKGFKREGLWGLTIPPIPAQTPVAWTTFMTGKNPGRHGIFSFAMRRRGTYERRIISPSSIKAEPLWDILSREGRRVGVINVPMTFPGRVRGFMIPGFLSREEGIPHPPSLRAKLMEERDGWGKIRGDLDPETLMRVEKDPDTFFLRVEEMDREVGEVSLRLLEGEEWDFFMTVFMGLDRVQHFFWRYVDEAHPTHIDDEYGSRVRGQYELIDNLLAEHISKAPEGTVTLLLSDHGFCPIWREVVLNNYLKELGVLKLKGDKIDMEESAAISYGYGDIWLNVKGREPKGFLELGEEYERIRGEIIQGLEALKIDGERPIKAVKRREEIYHGDWVEEAPDLIAIFNPGWQAARRPEIEVDKGRDGRYIHEEPRWSGGHDGTHDPKDVPGILGLLGPGMEGLGEDFIAGLEDLAPSILSILGHPVPEDMDGHPLILNPF